MWQHWILGPGPHAGDPPDSPRTLPQSWPLLALIALVLLVVAPTLAHAQSASGPGLLGSVQGGPYVAATTGTGATLEYGIRAEASKGWRRLDARVSLIPIQPARGCNPESRLCRRTFHVEALGGIGAALGSSPDAPALGWRLGLGYGLGYQNPKVAAITGPHLSLGLPLTQQIGLRAETGAVLYLVRDNAPGGRAYVSLGFQLRR